MKPEWEKQKKRTNAAIARAVAGNMSDTKWRKVFATLYDSGTSSIRWKFVRDDTVFTTGCLAPSALLDHSLGDVLPYPYGPYREIDWIEAMTASPGALQQRLLDVGQLDLAPVDGGIRIHGYRWPSGVKS